MSPIAPSSETEIPAPVLELSDALRLALQRVFRRIKQESDDSDSGVTLMQNMLLATIAEQPGVGVAELARREKLRGPTMSGHINALEHAGLVTRAKADPADRRRVGLLATELGHQVLAELRGRRRDWLARKLAQLPDEGVSALRLAIHYLNEIGA